MNFKDRNVKVMKTVASSFVLHGKHTEAVVQTETDCLI